MGGGQHDRRAVLAKAMIHPATTNPQPPLPDQRFVNGHRRPRHAQNQPDGLPQLHQSGLQHASYRGTSGTCKLPPTSLCSTRGAGHPWRCRS